MGTREVHTTWEESVELMVLEFIHWVVWKSWSAERHHTNLLRRSVITRGSI